MVDKISEIEVNGKKYPFAFNLNVLEKIQINYGTLQKWSELVDNKDEANIKALKFGICEMINEGIDIENEELEEKRQFLTEKQVGRLITEIGLKNITQKVKKTIVDSTASEQKNV